MTNDKCGTDNNNNNGGSKFPLEIERIDSATEQQILDDFRGLLQKNI